MNNYMTEKTMTDDRAPSTNSVLNIDEKASRHQSSFMHFAQSRNEKCSKKFDTNRSSTGHSNRNSFKELKTSSIILPSQREHIMQLKRDRVLVDITNKTRGSRNSQVQAHSKESVLGSAISSKNTLDGFSSSCINLKVKVRPGSSRMFNHKPA